ncbi:MAG: hypothetical protein HGJ94_08875 [Desulfosarcina sp.]|nr:hypothetical protein [Desulfosarcina sp.]MBC2745259.1 hypothetical protein [Desulfosarcina sp.]MBC2768166.1 hypothetical protein [Desulfosarcina sp.]
MRVIGDSLRQTTGNVLPDGSTPRPAHCLDSPRLCRMEGRANMGHWLELMIEKG